MLLQASTYHDGSHHTGAPETRCHNARDKGSTGNASDYPRPNNPHRPNLNKTRGGKNFLPMHSPAIGALQSHHPLKHSECGEGRCFETKKFESLKLSASLSHSVGFL